MEMMANYSRCRRMLGSMVRATMKSISFSLEQKPFHGGNNHFDDDLFSVMENFVKLTGKKVTFNAYV